MKFSGWSEFPAHKNILSADLEPMGEGRPEGLHLSEILHEWKIGNAERVGSSDGEQEGVRLIEGFLWETALEYMSAGMGFDKAMEIAFARHMTALRSDVVTQLRLEKDGIHMTPDGFNEEEGIIESYKYTRRSFKKAKSAEDFRVNFWLWVAQEMSYCLAKGVDTARWIVCFAAGDYDQGPGAPPKILQATATWTPEELVEHWVGILRYRDRRIKRLEKENAELQCGIECAADD